MAVGQVELLGDANSLAVAPPAEPEAVLAPDSAAPASPASARWKKLQAELRGKVGKAIMDYGMIMSTATA